jgi:PKD repeat protein
LISTIGASYVTINGESVTGQRNLTLALPASLNSNNIKVVSIGSTDSISTTDISILNCNIIGSSTTTAINTAFGIYVGYFNPATAFQNAVIGLNNNMVFTNNYIQAVRTGIHIRGTNTAGRQNRTLLINKNIIGGTVKRGDGAPLTYLGGATDQAGIFIKSVSFVTVDSNIIRNSDSSAALSNGFRGIDLDAGGSTTALDSSVSITRNTIYNLTTATGAYCVGIRVNLNNANSRRLYIVNNSIAKIRGVGSASGGSATNPAGIQIDGSGTVTNLGLEMYQNTVQLSGNTLTGTNSSYCLFFGGAIQGGVNLQNNLLTNRLGRVSTLGGFSYGMFSNTTLANSPFRLITNGSINSNAYGAEGLNTNNFIVGNTTTNYQFMQQWSTAANQDFNSFNFAAFFANDSTPFPNLALAGRIANGSLRIPSITSDIMGNVRSGTFTSTGALQFVATFLPLAGNSVYKINGVTNLPTAGNTPPYSFATINRAFEYINSNGVDAVSPIPQPITLLIEAGYIGEGDTLIAPLGSYPNANFSRPITLKNDFGRNDTIRTLGILMPYQANGSVLRFVGASFFTIDGSADGSGSRNITIMLPSAATANSLKLIDLTSGEKTVSNITIRNCNLIGNVNATINTFAGIYMGGILATPSNPTIGKNNDNTFDNNFIVGVRNGIYAQGFTTNFNQHDLRLRLRRNIIGGVGSALTDRFGGVANAAGIYVNAQAIATVDSNVVRNNAPAFTLNRGIELGSTSAARTIDSAISVTRNTIQNITSNLASAGAYGIFVSLLSDSFNNITIANNMISGIKAAGTVSVTSYSAISPFGIWVESTGTVNTIGLNIWNNSINLGLGNTLGTTSNAVSACIGFNNSVRGGVALRNNILQNRLGRSAAGTGTASSIVIGSTTSIFSICDNNIYHSLAPNTTNNIGVFNAFTNPDRDSTLAMWIDATKQDSMSVSINTNFTNDTTLTILPTNTAILRGWPISAVSTDLTGDVRDIFNPTIGADEISGGTPVDSAAPNVFNLTKLPTTCSNGPYPIIYRVFTRQNNIRDTLFYSVNGLPEVFITTPSVSGYTRVYTIPAQSPNSSIAYRLSISTVSSPTFTVKLPATGYEYISTTFDAFPITEGFDGPNVNGWTVQSEGPNGPTSPAAGGWILGSFGSASNPVVTPATGIKAALFPSNTLPKNTLSRLISPCLDLTFTKIPTVRIWVSQNSDLLTRLDRIRVSASTGFGWSQLAFINRPNPNLPFPEFTKLDVCLANFVGINGVRIAIEGLSDNGQNIVLDSIVIFDDILPTTFTPAATTICAKDPLIVSLATSSADYTYELVDAFTGLSVGDPIKGTGSPLTVSAPNPSNPLVGRVDSIWVVVKYTNISSACQYFLTDTSKITIRSFFNGPFISEGTPYTGAFLNGTAIDPDGARNQDTLNYTILAPSDLANADYGLTWTIVNQSVATATGTPISNAVLFPASSLTDARYSIITGVSDLDSVFILKATLRLLPSNCDSLITRYIKVVSAPVASFTNASDSVCSGAPIGFLNTTTFDVKTAPITYVWNFGDGTSSFTRDAFKVYSFNTAAGVYTVKLTATNNAGVSTEYSKQIRVLPAPVPSYTTTLACGSDSIPFTNNSTGASSYLWTSRLNGATVATSTATNPKFSFAFSDTVYNVTLRATNTLGCNRDTTVGVFSFAKPVASFAVANHCLGLNASFNNTSTIIPGSNGRVNSFGSAWDFGNGQIGLSNSPVYRYPQNGTYTVKLRTTSNYGCTDSATGTVTVFDKPRTGFTNGPACQDAAVAINNTTTYSGGASNVLYTWDFGDFSPNSTDFNPTKAYGAKGLYNLILVAHDAINGCYDTTVKSIEVNEAPLALYSVGNGCQGTPLQFSNGSIPPVGQTLTFNWNFGDGNSSISASPLHTYTGIGVFNITLEATTNKGCKNIAQIAKDSVIITSAPSVGYTKRLLSCNLIEFVPNIKGSAGYFWEFGDGATSRAVDTITNIYQTKGVYTVKLTITSATGCQGTITDTLHIDCTVGFKEEFESKFNLSVYPNPFENNATVSYNLDSKQDVKVTVLDVLARKVSEVIENNQSAGNHSIKLDESNFTATSALYMVRIQIGDEAITKQLLHK